jgi:hypothetical protein
MTMHACTLAALKYTASPKRFIRLISVVKPKKKDSKMFRYESLKKQYLSLVSWISSHHIRFRLWQPEEKY